MLLDEQASNALYEKVKEFLHFFPTTDIRCIPFSISAPYVVYDISKVSETTCEQFDQLISGALGRCTHPGEKLYAMDWFHCSFLYDPQIPEERKHVYLGEHPFLPGQGLYADFPSYYPDGDYSFFMDEKFRFGYLSHPWRKEVWIFGACLMAEFDKIQKQLGWTVKEDL